MIGILSQQHKLTKIGQIYISRNSDKFKWEDGDPCGPVVIILATGSEVRVFKPGRGRWIFSERKSPEYEFLQKGSKAVGPML